MSLLPDEKDLQALGEHLGQKITDYLMAAIVTKGIPALREAALEVADGLHCEVKVTLDVTRRP